MRVLHFLKSNIYSGAEHVVCTMIHHMPQEDECYYVSPDGPISQRLQEEHINHIVIDKMTPAQVKKTICRMQPDVVHAHDFTASVVVAYACRNVRLSSGKRPRVISHLHCNPTWLQSRNAKTILYRMASRWMDDILTVSDAIAEEYVYRDSISGKVTTIGNPFSVQEIRQLGDANNIDTDTLRSDILYVGRLSQPKNPIGFLEIVDKLQEQMDMTGMRVIMIGEGELRAQCEAYIDHHKLTELVTMVGFQRNPYAYMAHTKVLVMPSEWEGFGLVALEAMVFGIPVVCSGAGGLKTIVDDSCGKIVESVTNKVQEEEIKQYIEEIKQLLMDESYYQTKSDNAMRRAESFDNVGSYMECLLSIYNRS